MVLRQNIHRFLLIIIVLLASFANAVPLAAQPAVSWSRQERIPGYFDTTRPPYLVADQNQTVHAFASQRYGEGPDSQVVITYNRWTRQDGWTKPIDIMLSPVYEARIMGVFLDPLGIMHLLFFGGNDNSASIYYSRAAAVEADKAQAWSLPVPIGDSAITPNIGGLVGDNHGHLVAVYSGNLGEGNSLYAINSKDNGLTWDSPTLLWSTYSTALWPSDFQMVVGASGQVHAVWNYVDKLGKNVTGYYAYLDKLESPQWSEPTEIDKSIGLGIAALSVAEYHKEVYVIYNNGILDSNNSGQPSTAPVLWVRRTRDNGKTWSNPQRPFASHVGRNGAASIVVDSADVLHILFGERTPQGKIDMHGMWTSSLRNGAWTPPQAVVVGPLVQGNDDKAFDPGGAQAVVSQGNTLLVTWFTDPGNGVNGVWFAYAQLNTPAWPIQPLPVPQELLIPTPASSAVTIAPTAVATPAPTAITVTFDPANVGPTQQTTNAAAPLLAGITPVMMLLAGIFFIKKARQTSPS